MSTPAEVQTWMTELRTVALVGTSRRQPPAAPRLLGTPGPEHDALLDQAAFFDVMSRAGNGAVEGEALTPCAEESRPVAPKEATRLLSLLLTQPPVSTDLAEELLRLWLASCAEKKFVIAPETLPKLFDYAAKRRWVRPAMSEVWGERGRWLASLLHPRFLASAVEPEHTAAASPAEHDALVAAWPTLDTAAATASLTTLRSVDPTRARALLTDNWKSLSAKARAAHLEALEEGISLDDEEFLEAALDDRAKGVRQAAATILSDLPGSQLRSRMGERLKALITVHKKLLRPPKIDVGVPSDVDAQGIRDGLEPRSDKARGQGEVWLGDIVEAAPLETWTEVTGLKPQQIVEALSSDGHRAMLSRAIAVSGDRTWADALVGVRTVSGRAVAAMSPHVRQMWLLRHIPTASDTDSLIAAAAVSIPRPWPQEVAEAVVTRLADAIDYRPLVAHFNAEAIAAVPATAIPTIRQLLERPLKSPDQHTQARTKLRAIISFQAFAQSIRQSFATSEETP